MYDFAGPRGLLISQDPITTAAGEVTIYEDYILAGCQGIILDVYHLSSGSATVVYKIYALPFTSDVANWPSTSPVAMLTSASIAKATQARLVVDPRVTAVSNTHAQTVLPYMVRITATVSTADASQVFASLTMVN